MRRLMAFVPLIVGACSTVPAESAAAPANQETTAQTCRSEGLDQFVGRARSPETESALLRQSGAKIVRWVAKGTMITMEFREDRVTAWLDSNNRIERANCG